MLQLETATEPLDRPACLRICPPVMHALLPEFVAHVLGVGPSVRPVLSLGELLRLVGTFGPRETFIPLGIQIRFIAS